MVELELCTLCVFCARARGKTTKVTLMRLRFRARAGGKPALSVLLLAALLLAALLLSALLLSALLLAASLRFRALVA